MTIAKCLECNEHLSGRIDKKFCSPHCKSAYHYKKRDPGQFSYYEQIDKQLKFNRRILKMYNKAGKATVRKSVLLEEGFNPKYFTHYWKNRKGKVYLFCYEYGFLQLKEKNRFKYVLIKWQDYMN